MPVGKVIQHHRETQKSQREQHDVPGHAAGFKSHVSFLLYESKQAFAYPGARGACRRERQSANCV